MSFDYQKELRRKSRSKVINALMRSRMTYTELKEQTKLSDRTLSIVLKEMEDDRTIYAVYFDKKRRQYVMNEIVSDYIKRENLYVFERLDEMRNRYDLTLDENGQPARTVNGVSFVPSLDTFFPVISSSTLMEGELTEDTHTPSEYYFLDVGLLADGFALFSYWQALDKAFAEMGGRVSKDAPKDKHGIPIINMQDDDFMRKLCSFEGMSITSVLVDYKALGNAIGISLWFYRRILNRHSLSEIYPYDQFSADLFAEDQFSSMGITQKEIDKMNLPEKPGREDAEEILFGYIIPRHLITLRKFLKHFSNTNYTREFHEFLIKVQHSVDDEYKVYLTDFKQKNSTILKELQSMLYFDEGIPLDLMIERFGHSQAKSMLALFTGIILISTDVTMEFGAKVVASSLNSYGDWTYGIQNK